VRVVGITHVCEHHKSDQRFRARDTTDWPYLAVLSLAVQTIVTDMMPSRHRVSAVRTRARLDKIEEGRLCLLKKKIASRKLVKLYNYNVNNSRGTLKFLKIRRDSTPFPCVSIETATTKEIKILFWLRWVRRNRNCWRSFFEPTHRSTVVRVPFYWILQPNDTTGSTRILERFVLLFCYSRYPTTL
jgi:hypothetical protein